VVTLISLIEVDMSLTEVVTFISLTEVVTLISLTEVDVCP
jgi:hypothetical protein